MKEFWILIIRILLKHPIPDRMHLVGQGVGRQGRGRVPGQELSQAGQAVITTILFLNSEHVTEEKRSYLKKNQFSDCYRNKQIN